MPLVEVGPERFVPRHIGLATLSIRVGDPARHPQRAPALEHQLDAVGATLERVFVALNRDGDSKSLEPCRRRDGWCTQRIALATAEQAHLPAIDDANRWLIPTSPCAARSGRRPGDPAGPITCSKSGNWYDTPADAVRLQSGRNAQFPSTHRPTPNCLTSEESATRIPGVRVSVGRARHWKFTYPDCNQEAAANPSTELRGSKPDTGDSS